MSGCFIGGFTGCKGNYNVLCKQKAQQTLFARCVECTKCAKCFV